MKNRSKSAPIVSPQGGDAVWGMTDWEMSKSETPEVIASVRPVDDGDLSEKASSRLPVSTKSGDAAWGVGETEVVW